MHHLEFKKKKKTDRKETHTHVQPQLNYNKEHFMWLV